MASEKVSKENVKAEVTRRRVLLPQKVKLLL